MLMSNPRGLQMKQILRLVIFASGEQLEREAALATPKHSYVPWILVDSVPLGEPLTSLVD